MERKLAAMLYADVAGYSRLTGTDEEGTHRTLRDRLAALADRIETGGGRICHFAGDAVLAEFSSVTASVDAAVAAQLAFAKLDQHESEDRKLRFRIGINLGEVIVDGQEIYGNGVNVAARLEALANPGGICISNRVVEQLEGKLQCPLEDLGPQMVKNIDRPVHAFRLNIGDTATPDDSQAPPTARDDKPSVAILPFTNMSADQEQAFFADGLTEEIITMMSAWRAFPVIASNSTFAYRGQTLDVKKVASELGARYVVEGSVRRGGGRVRITAQLIDALSGHQVWTERYDREIDDVLAVQEDVAVNIAATVQPELEKLELKHSSTRRTRSVPAWEYAVRGQALLNAYTPKDNAQARASFESALEIDPDYSDAHAGLAFSYLRDVLLEAVGDREEWVRRALEAARKSVALDGSSSYAHLTLGTAYIWADEHDLSVEETRIAVELNPSNFQACLALGNRLDLSGEHEQGLAVMERALQLNPRDPRTHTYYCYVSRALVNARRYEEALAAARRAVGARASYPQSHFLEAICLSHLNRCDEARAAAAECNRVSPCFVEKRANWNAYRDRQANAHLLSGLRQCGII